MPIPLFFVGLGLAAAEYVILKPHPTMANPFPDGNRPGPVPVPVPAPSVTPPPGMIRLAGVDVVADLSNAVYGAANQSVPVTWTFTSGPSNVVDTGGGGMMPLAWMSPDKSQAAVVWNVDPAYFLGDDTFKPGAIYSARPMQSADVPFFASVFGGGASPLDVATGVVNPSAML